MINFETGTIFPFKEHRERIERYKDNYMLYEGKFKDLLDKYNVRSNSRLYVAVNLAGIVAHKPTDLLVGEAIQVNSGKPINSKEQLALDKMTLENSMNIVNYQNALMCAITGDCFYRIRYGQKYGGEFPPNIDKPRVFIEDIEPWYVFPESTKGSSRELDTFHICIPRFDNQLKRWILDCETHVPYYVRNHSYTLHVIEKDYYGEPEAFKIDEQIGDDVVTPTGVLDPLVIHIPNGKTRTWEGKDDLSEHKQLFDELNNRLSQVASILDKHADPAITVPTGLLETDELGNPIFSIARDKVFELTGKDDIKPEYVTWNGQLNEAYTEIDKIVDLLLISAEIPKVALGMGDAGTSGSAGSGIKYRMASILSKVNRKRQYFDKGLREVYFRAEQLEKALGIADYEPVIPQLDFKDGLPKDETVEANVMAVRISSGTISKASAIKYLDNLTDEQVKEEMDRIKEEQQGSEVVTDVGNLFNEDYMDEEQKQEKELSDKTDRPVKTEE